jgi:taurine dioxygenase
VVRTHPETGEKILYVNEGHTLRFEDRSEEASAPLLALLYQQLRKPEYQCRFRWSHGALAMWDNRAAQHYPVNDYHGHRRLLHRISLKGERPV